MAGEISPDAIFDDTRGWYIPNPVPEQERDILLNLDLMASRIEPPQKRIAMYAEIPLTNQEERSMRDNLVERAVSKMERGLYVPMHFTYQGGKPSRDPQRKKRRKALQQRRGSKSGRP